VTATPLARSAGSGRPAPPVRLVHLGLGNFFRAHQAWYTQRAPDGAEWGIAAFSGHDRSTLARRLTAQEGLYTLVTRAPDADRFEVVSAVARSHTATDDDAWSGYFRSPALAAVTVTVTEAGYLRADGGGLDVADPAVDADVETLRRDITAHAVTAPGRLAAGFAARRQADAGPMALVPCDNLQHNGAIAARVVLDLAALVDPDLASWIAESVSIVTTVVDRITPRTEPGDLRTVARATGSVDRCPVVTEPFHEWVLSGTFPAGRPHWEGAGATFVDDVTPFEHRKLWLLNGAHSLLAYAGSARGHATVAEAVEDEVCRRWLDQWWSEAAPHVGQSADGVEEYRTALLERFANRRIRHRLDQIAADGSQKLPMRILPVLGAERSAGRVPEGALRVLAAWISHLRGGGAPVVDVRAGEFVELARGSLPDAVRHVLGALDPSLAGDGPAVAVVVSQCAEFEHLRDA